jgi:hypothetical protein
MNHKYKNQEGKVTIDFALFCQVASSAMKKNQSRQPAEENQSRQLAWPKYFLKTQSASDGVTLPSLFTSA